MALTGTQKAAIRLYVGWSARFGQYDSRLERAIAAIDGLPEHLAQITNLLTGDPPGLLAQLADVDAKLRAAHGRLKADEVGTITLNRAEMGQLRAEGRRMVGRLCSILGVPREHDVFGSGAVTQFAGFGGGHAGNYVGK